MVSKVLSERATSDGVAPATEATLEEAARASDGAVPATGVAPKELGFYYDYPLCDVEPAMSDLVRSADRKEALVNK